MTRGVIANRIRELGYLVSTGDANLERATFQVAGMDCQDCAKTLQASVANISGGRSAEVSFSSGVMRVEFGHDPVPPALIISAAERLGY